MNLSLEKASRNVRWFSDFFDKLPIGIYRVTLEGSFIFCNRCMARIFGFGSAEELLQYPAVNLYWDKTDRGNFIRVILENGKAHEVNLLFKTLQGEPIWCADTARPVFDEDGILLYLDGIIRNIPFHTEGTESNARLDTGENSLNDLVVLLDLDGTMLDINETGSGLLGRAKSDLIDRSFADFIVAKGRGLFPLFLAEVRKTGRKEAILTLNDSTGQELIIEFHAFLVRKAGKMDHIRGIAKDITEKVRHRSEELARERFEGVLEMAGGVAHKMNQPLTIMNNLLQEVLDALPDDPDQREKLGRIQDQMVKLNEIAAKIRCINRYESMDYIAGVKIVDLDTLS